MQKVISVGGITVDKDHILLIKLESGLCAIPKGHKELNETDEQTALREVEEETGFKAEIVNYVGELTRQAKEKNGEIVEKTIKVYKMRKIGLSEITPDEKSIWVKASTAVEHMHFKEEADFLKKHLPALLDS